MIKVRILDRCEFSQRDAYVLAGEAEAFILVRYCLLISPKIGLALP